MQEKHECIHEDRWEEMTKKVDNLDSNREVLAELKTLVKIQGNTANEQTKTLATLTKSMTEISGTMKNINEKIEETRLDFKAEVKALNDKIELDKVKTEEHKNQVTFKVLAIWTMCSTIVASLLPSIGSFIYSLIPHVK